nr:sensor histidine kinase [uncultured bacterium]
MGATIWFRFGTTRVLRLAVTAGRTGRGMNDTRELSSRDLEAAKLAALAEFAAGAGHEINNPLATISGRVQLLLRDETDPERRRTLTTIGGQVYRIRDMIGDLMLFARPPAPQPQMLDLNAVVQSVSGSFAEKLADAQCTLQIDAEGNLAIWADGRQLEIVIGCLLQNSIEASSPGGLIRLETRSGHEANQRMAVVRVTDNGSGIDETTREHLFDPFFSGRRAGRGLGFGLSKCWRIVTNHAGRISVASAPGDATTFEVIWPAESRSN